MIPHTWLSHFSFHTKWMTRCTMQNSTLGRFSIVTVFQGHYWVCLWCGRHPLYWNDGSSILSSVYLPPSWANMLYWGLQNTSHLSSNRIGKMSSTQWITVIFFRMPGWSRSLQTELWQRAWSGAKVQRIFLSVPWECKLFLIFWLG